MLKPADKKVVCILAHFHYFSLFLPASHLLVQTGLFCTYPFHSGEDC